MTYEHHKIKSKDSKKMSVWCYGTRQRARVCQNNNDMTNATTMTTGGSDGKRQEDTGTIEKDAREKNESIPDDDDVPLPPLLDWTTASLGVILIVLCGIFINQAGELFHAYMDLQDSEINARGVTRIRLGDGVQAEVAAYVERNEPFVCRKCLPTTSFWDNDANIVEAVGADTVLPVRVAERTEDKKVPTQFRRAAAPGTRGEDSAYLERNMTMTDFIASYNNQESKEHLYAAQVNVISALPGLMPHIQETAPPTNFLEAVGNAPPRSHRPIRYVRIERLPFTSYIPTFKTH